MQILNVLLAKKKESRKRSLMYHVPRVVSLNTHVSGCFHPQNADRTSLFRSSSGVF
jgi:hypothetical protein